MKKVTIPVTLVVMVVVLAGSVECVGQMGGHARTSGRRHSSMMLHRSRVGYTNHTMPNQASHRDDDDVDPLLLVLTVVLFSSGIVLLAFIRLCIEKTSVIMVQVAVKGDPSDLQRDLFITSKIANPKKRAGLKYILSETASRLLRHSNCCYSANSSVCVFRPVKDTWRTYFNCICDKEINQFDGTNVLWRRTRRYNEFVVVTILVAASGTHKLPEINSLVDLEKALVYLKSIKHFDIHAVKVFWTPEDGHTKLLKKDLDEHFPLLRLLLNIEGTF